MTDDALMDWRPPPSGRRLPDAPGTVPDAQFSGGDVWPALLKRRFAHAQ